MLASKVLGPDSERAFGGVLGHMTWLCSDVFPRPKHPLHCTHSPVVSTQHVKMAWPASRTILGWACPSHGASWPPWWCVGLMPMMDFALPCVWALPLPFLSFETHFFSFPVELRAVQFRTVGRRWVLVKPCHAG